ncbi:MAG: hypothetical protein IPO08_00235 [Xanthomonadales bacterium]|jgi:hypothetical protein|nr:hypothetical protein [Xanthomonadales bacterium]
MNRTAQRQAAERLLTIMAELSAAGETVLTHMTGKRQTIEEWERFPNPDVEDESTGYRFYYHAHRCPGSKSEHGHFHVFKRISKGESTTDFTHLIAIGISPNGLPCRFFSTNTWVTGETDTSWRESIEMIRCFEMDPTCDALANQWIGSVLALYASDLLHVLRHRDAKRRRLRRARPRYYNDRRTIVLSQTKIDLGRKFAALDA